MQRIMSIISVVVITAAILTISVMPALAAPDPANQKNNWGQAVKTANQGDGYGEGVSRGEFVSGAAQDSDEPGYAGELFGPINVREGNAPGQTDPQGF